MSACLFASRASAEECAVIESRAALAPLSGSRITSIEIRSEGPALPGPLGIFDGLHPASRSEVIRRQLLFAPGDTVDTLRVGETLRRLRSQRLYSDAVILARRCDPTGGVSLLVRTRDTWTLRPTARLRTPSQLSVGAEEKNFLGTGRTLAVTHEMTMRGSGNAIAVSDPFLFGRDVAANARLANISGAHVLKLGVRRHEYSVFDNWRAEANFSRLSYQDTLVNERALHTISAMTLVGHRIGNDPLGTRLLLIGAEFDSAASISTSRRANALPGAPHVRSFLGLDLGFARRTAVFDSAGWIAPGRGFLDVPMGWEGEGIVGVGHERDARTAALKIDGWTGRAFLPRRGAILMLDGWLSSYFGRGVDRNEIIRVSGSYYSLARGGMWGARVIAEELEELDPDRRGLSLMPLADATAPVVRPYGARGGRSIAASLDRDVRVAQLGATSVLNVGGFLAGSYRWQVDDVPSNQLRAGVVGARFRVLSANGAVSSVRVDVGYPVMRSEILSRNPFVVLNFGTFFDAARQRDGRRAY